MNAVAGETARKPASGPSVREAIAQALHVANTVAQNEQRQDGRVNDHCRLWQELLTQSRAQLVRDTVPTIPRGEVAIPAAVKLTERRWASFQRWFGRKILPPLQQASVESRIPILYGERISDRRGGRAELCEARYFLSFEAPVAALQNVSVRRRPS